MARSEPVKETTVLAKILNDESGATAIEYGMVAGSITVAIVATLSTIGATLQGDWYEPIRQAIEAAVNG
ncbi:Flp family type IVb pilin [Stappia sp. GBMRC 2046]|uniref:Flp family type IVb pilin n=2 Tax=Stappia sediminis TaxID=2692190 RepID=A0A7X3LU98_9HYPH|nr:Flp family type IVb pilin [Stappia sediminis]